MFTGQEFDDETSLYNYRARLYDPYLKRFLDTDPAGQGFSPYAYAGNNPVYFVDPTGQFIDIGFLLFSAISSGFMSASTADFYGGSFFGGFMKGFTIGAFTSLAGQAASVGVYSLFDPTANQLIAGAASEAAGGFASGATNALMTGGNSLKSGLISGGISGVLGGIAGGLDNIKRGYTFWGGDSDKQLDPKLLFAYVFLKDKNSNSLTYWSEGGGRDLHSIHHGEWSNDHSIFIQNGKIDIAETIYGSYYFSKIASMAHGFILAGASYHIKGDYKIYYTKSGQRKVDLNAIGLTPVDKLGNVNFTADADLIVNGKNLSSGSFINKIKGQSFSEAGTHYIGRKKFNLPLHRNIQIRIRGIYSLSQGGGLVYPNLYDGTNMGSINITPF